VDFWQVLVDVSNRIFVDYLAMSSPWEGLAVILSVAYLLLAVKESSLCWYAAFFSTLIFTLIFWDASLLMDSALQVYYLLMAIYGWYQWQYVARQRKQDLRPIVQWPLKWHLWGMLCVLCASALSGYLLERHSQAAWPYLDSSTTWASVITTYMVAKKVLENWLYWIVIDSVSVLLYVDRQLYPTALLFIVYTAVAGYGFWRWLQHFKQQQKQAATAEAFGTATT
jgi:nicotinamide mononucleotide transporter